MKLELANRHLAHRRPRLVEEPFDGPDLRPQPTVGVVRGLITVGLLPRYGTSTLSNISKKAASSSSVGS